MLFLVPNNSLLTWLWLKYVQPDIKAIKKRIEDLITRDYLERDKENPNMFKYLAWMIRVSRVFILLGIWWWRYNWCPEVQEHEEYRSFFGVGICCKLCAALLENSRILKRSGEFFVQFFAIKSQFCAIHPYIHPYMGMLIKFVVALTRYCSVLCFSRRSSPFFIRMISW